MTQHDLRGGSVGCERQEPDQGPWSLGPLERGPISAPVPTPLHTVGTKCTLTTQEVSGKVLKVLTVTLEEATR